MQRDLVARGDGPGRCAAPPEAIAAQVGVVALAVNLDSEPWFFVA